MRGPIPQDRTGAAPVGPPPTRPQQTSPDVAWALKAIAGRATLARFYGGYYAGEHRLMIDQTRLRTIFGRLFSDFRLNLCGAVVDALNDRLQVASFGVADELTGAEDAELAGKIWRANAMRRQQIEVHRSAIACGDGYALVWPDASGNPRVYPQASYEVAVSYDAEDPGRVAKAAKLWPTADPTSDPLRPKRLWRLNLYFPDRVEKWAASGTSAGGDAEGMADAPVGAPPSAKAFSPYAEEDGGVWPLLNPYGQVPVFHFANRSSALGASGVSELRDAVPIQDWINYSVFSMLVGQEFQGFPQRYAIGVEVPTDEATGLPINPFRAGPERMWIADPAVNQDAEGNERAASVVMGQFNPADLGQLLEVKREASLSMSQATGTPPHHFILPTGMVSGESQKTADSKLDTKVGDRQANFGDVWSRAMDLGVRIARQGGPSGAGEALGVSFWGGNLETNWLNLKPRDEEKEWKVAELKAKRGVSDAQILREQGYTDEQIEEFAVENAEASAAAQERLPPALRNGGGPAPEQNEDDEGAP